MDEKRSIFTWHMRRSGGHAIKFWILSHFEDPNHPLFDLEYLWKLRLANRSTNRKDREQWRKLSTKSVEYDNTAYFHNFHRFRFRSFNSMIKGIDKPNLFFSFEDSDFLNFLGYFYPRLSNTQYADFTNIILLRDPFNMFASRIELLKLMPSLVGREDYHPFGNPRWFGKWIRLLWFKYADEFRGITNLLPNKIAISYNKWFSDESYRRGLSEKIGRPFTDVFKDKVFPYGLGSSFDKGKYRHRASQMKVFERWRNLSDDDLYLSLFDEDVIRISEQIFGHIPGTEEIIEKALQRKGKVYNC